MRRSRKHMVRHGLAVTAFALAMMGVAILGADDSLAGNKKPMRGTVMGKNELPRHFSTFNAPRRHDLRRMYSRPPLRPIRRGTLGEDVPASDDEEMTEAEKEEAAAEEKRQRRAEIRERLDEINERRDLLNERSSSRMDRLLGGAGDGPRLRSNATGVNADRGERHGFRLGKVEPRQSETRSLSGMGRSSERLAWASEFPKGKNGDGSSDVARRKWSPRLKQPPKAMREFTFEGADNGRSGQRFRWMSR